MYQIDGAKVGFRHSCSVFSFAKSLSWHFVKIKNLQSGCIFFTSCLIYNKTPLKIVNIYEKENLQES